MFTRRSVFKALVALLAARLLPRRDLEVTTPEPQTVRVFVNGVPMQVGAGIPAPRFGVDLGFDGGLVWTEISDEFASKLEASAKASRTAAASRATWVHQRSLLDDAIDFTYKS